MEEDYLYIVTKYHPKLLGTCRIKDGNLELLCVDGKFWKTTKVLKDPRDVCRPSDILFQGNEKEYLKYKMARELLK